MRHTKRILAFSLSFALAFSQMAYAEQLITPHPLSGNVVSETSGTTQETSAASEAGATAQGTSAAAETGATAQETSAAAETGAAAQETSAAAQSSQIAEPVVSANGAVVIHADTGEVLFGKNADEQYYPASITKVMTALLVLENAKLDEIVTFSKTATTNLESGAVSLNLTEGDKLTVEQCLYGLLLKSANEIGNGLAEHIAGSVDAFAEMMNQRAKELGCKNTNFKNPHGLNHAEHKTTPYDMALIMREALKNETFRKIATTTTYVFPATKQEAARTLTMGHKMLHPTDYRYYEGMIGGKTGYTSLAGNTLVTGAERDGVRLVAVVMQANGTHYADTKALFDYGFAVCAERSSQSEATLNSTETIQGESETRGAEPGDRVKQAQEAE